MHRQSTGGSSFEFEGRVNLGTSVSRVSSIPTGMSGIEGIGSRLQKVYAAEREGLNRS
jgi:hypothetical protein